MSQKYSLTDEVIKMAADELLEILKDREDVKIHQFGKGQIFISTLAPNFKVHTEGPCWKISGMVDLINGTYKFCQSDAGGADNWTQVTVTILKELFAKVYPDFVQTFKTFLPDNKHHLFDDLFDQVVTCAEVVFALKEVMAFNQLLKAVVEKKMEESKLLEILHSLTFNDNDNVTYPYSGSLEDAVSKVLEEIIKLLKSNPIPINLKKFGRKAYLYGYLAFSKNPEAKEVAAIVNPMESELFATLVECKENIVSYNKKFLDFWKFCHKYDIRTIEVSSDDSFWGGWVIPDCVENPKPEGVSVLGYSLALATKLTVEETQTLKNWTKEPFTGEIMNKLETIFSGSFNKKAKNTNGEFFQKEGFFELVSKGEFMKTGKNQLGKVNTKVTSNLAEKFGWVVSA